MNVHAMLDQIGLVGKDETRFGKAGGELVVERHIVVALLNVLHVEMVLSGSVGRVLGHLKYASISIYVAITRIP